jgi:hypothetical protein
VQAFAQQEMPYTFLHGVDPDYQQFMEDATGQAMAQMAELIAQADDHWSDEERPRLRSTLLGLAKREHRKLKTRLSEYRDKNLSGPVESVVAVLPKEELAEMAEALVSLTSLKRKMSQQDESVGGPIDVALISKGDGLVWVRRKHYFPSELNPHFTATYMER